MGFGDGSGISWTTCKRSAYCSRQITTPTTHHSIFTGRMLFLTPNQQCQSTEGRMQLQVKSVTKESKTSNSYSNRIIQHTIQNTHKQRQIIIIIIIIQDSAKKGFNSVGCEILLIADDYIASDKYLDHFQISAPQPHNCSVILTQPHKQGNCNPNPSFDLLISESNSLHA